MIQVGNEHLADGDQEERILQQVLTLWYDLLLTLKFTWQEINAFWCRIVFDLLVKAFFSLVLLLELHVIYAIEGLSIDDGVLGKEVAEPGHTLQLFMACLLDGHILDGQLRPNVVELVVDLELSLEVGTNCGAL